MGHNDLAAPPSPSCAMVNYERRAGVDSAALKGMVQEFWAVSDGLSRFERALEDRSLFLAKCDRRGQVVLSYEGEVCVLARRMIGPHRVVQVDC